MSAPKKHFWLVAAQLVVLFKEGGEAQKGFNVSLTTDDYRINRADIGKAQKGVLHRYVSECDQVPGAQIADVFIQNISYLGLMTAAEFHEGFADAKAEEAVANQGVQ